MLAVLGRFLSLPLLTFPLFSQPGFEILQKNCTPCHGSLISNAGLDLRSRNAMLKGGGRGPAVVPGKATESRIYRFAAALEEPRMPPGSPLSSSDLQTLHDWINAGAEVSTAATSDSANETEAAAALAKLEDRPITDKERQWWAFRKPVRPPVPNGKANPIDAFLAQTWQAKRLSPAAAADRRTLIRRLYLDVLGLPPSPEEVQSFLANKSPRAYEELVEKVLASPHYGERWARHWLDVVRYADSGGYEYDRDRDNAWRYRDYVVRSFNQDKPYNRFLQEQLAGDELFPDSEEARIATGMLRLGPENNIKSEQTRLDELDDVIATTSNSLFALTVGCARCHNHKFDPIPQKDYYRLQAVFWPMKATEHPLVTEEQVQQHKEAVANVNAAIKPLREELEALVKPYKDAWRAERISALPHYMKDALNTPADQRTEGQKLNAEQVEKTLAKIPETLPQQFKPADKQAYDALNQKIAELENSKPAPYPTAMSIAEEGPRPKPNHFLHRGSQKGSVVSPGTISVVSTQEWPYPEAPADAKTSHRRRHFAEWATQPDHPLTARVFVNRIWQHHFGEGLVRTPNNFGRMGERPTHPELLDWLAVEFVESGWRSKHLHRLILTSEAYRMASDDNAANLAKDPQNRYYWRMPRRRLEGEAIRDSILAVAGSLDRSIGGPGVYPFIDPSLFQASSKRTWNGKPDTDPSTWRRSIYVFSKRSIPLPMLEVFDKPDTIGSCARRNRSTVAPQALILMNNSMVHLHAERFAERLMQLAGQDRQRFVELAFEHAYSRPPSPAEKDEALSYLAQSAPQDFCQALVNSNEFIYIP
ncbi:MAG: PSD1 and planctomycete cytochrome C domain-containing protein [Bryobacter sp.]